MIGKDDNAFIFDKHEQDEIRNSDKQVLEENREIKLPVQSISLPNGSKKVLETIEVPFKNPLTKKINLLGVSFDKTGEHKVKDELHFTKNELRKAIQSINQIKGTVEKSPDYLHSK